MLALENSDLAAWIDFRDKLGKRGVPLRDLNKALKEVREKAEREERRAKCAGTESRGWAMTEQGNAERLAHYHGEDLVYTKEKGWMAWGGKRWGADAELGAVELMKAVNRKIPGEDDSDEAAAWAKASESSSCIQGSLRLARNTLLMDTERFDRDTMLLNVANGIIDLRTGELRPHRREDYITRISPVGYDPSAQCPRWEQFLLEAMDGDTEVVTFLQRAAGYSLTGSTKEEKFFFVYGSGRNGKSVFLETLKSILGGEYGPASQTTSLMRRRVENDGSAKRKHREAGRSARGLRQRNPKGRRAR